MYIHVCLLYSLYLFPHKAFGVFGLCQIHAFVDYLRSKLTDKQFTLLFKTLAITVGVASLLVGGALTALGSILEMTSFNISAINVALFQISKNM